MILGGIALIASLIFFPLGKILATLALPFTTYTIRTVEFFARMPHGVIVLGDMKLFLVILTYAAMLAWTFARFRLKKIVKPVTSALLLASLAIVTIQTWRVALAQPDGYLHLTFLNVGSADALLIQTPQGAKILVNGGERASALSSALGERLPPFHRELDWLIVAAPQEADLAALPRVLERFPPQQVLWSGNREASYAARDLEKYLLRAEIPLVSAEKGQVLDLGDGISLRIQAAGARGAVLLLEWDSFRAFLPIGMDFKNLDNARNTGEVSVLLLADSGYAPINPPELIEALHPQLVVLSVAADDWSGLPHQSVLRTVEGYSFLRTDENGWIQVTTDGKQMWVESER
jgi:beta-lactamase superfamily II metal-dependent hydrolase